MHSALLEPQIDRHRRTVQLCGSIYGDPNRLLPLVTTYSRYRHAVADMVSGSMGASFARSALFRGGASVLLKRPVRRTGETLRSGQARLGVLHCSGVRLFVSRQCRGTYRSKTVFAYVLNPSLRSELCNVQAVLRVEC